jgi:hypothetical protein
MAGSPPWDHRALNEVNQVSNRDSLCLSLGTPIVLLIATIAALGEQGSGLLPYNAAKGLAYAKQWCGSGNDCPSNQYDDPNNFDCTHFMCHVLES